MAVLRPIVQLVCRSPDIRRYAFVRGFRLYPAKGGWWTPVGGAERVVEAAYAAETGGEGDLRQWHARVVEQTLCGLHPAGRSEFARGGASMAKKQPQQVPRPDAQLLGKLAHRAAIEKALLDQAHAACDRRRRAVPGRAARRGFGAAAQARAEPRSLRRGSAGEEQYVRRLRRAYRTDRPAIDARRAYPGKKPPIIFRVARQASAVANLSIEAL
jgi:hypothetical protein